MWTSWPRKVYDRMTSTAEKLVPTAEQLEREFGIPIVNKRISVTPIAEICAAVTADDLTPVAVAMDRAGKEVGVDFVGGFSALVHKGATRADHKLMDSIPTALAATDRVCASVNVGSHARRHQHGRRASRWRGIVKRDCRGSPPTASASAPASSSCSATPWRTTPSWPALSTAPARPTKW